MITVKAVELVTLLPVSSDVSQMKIANRTIAEILQSRLAAVRQDGWIAGNFLISASLASQVAQSGNCRVVCGEEMLLSVGSGEEVLAVDEESLRIEYPWQLITATEKIVGEVTESDIPVGSYTPVVDGVLIAGKTTKFLPGVYIEGKVVIGENCKIGPNCYIRGNTSIGDNCHIGQAVEVKNSLLQDNVSVGHLSYLGDSVVCDHVNFGAGMVCGNLRHDGKNHRTMVTGQLMDTGRRKFGTIIGRNVHTGIHTSIYPGRKIGENATTRPGEVVQYDIPAQ